MHLSSEIEPPILQKRTEFVPAPLHGQWASLNCETRPMYFLTRHFMFLQNTTWEAHYHYFKDPACRTPIYALSVKGTHSQSTRSTKIPGGSNVSLTSLAMSLTPQHREMVRTLNSLSRGMCEGKPWRLGRTYDITHTGECTSLGNLVPSTDYDLVRMEEDPLYGLVMYMGQLPSDGGRKNEEHRRPTAYQEPMVHCEGEDPRHYASHSNTTIFNSGSSSVCQIRMLLGIVWLSYVVSVG